MKGHRETVSVEIRALESQQLTDDNFFCLSASKSSTLMEKSEKT